MDKYKNLNTEELHRLADSEAIADCCETMLQNSKLFENLVNENRNFAQKLIDAIKMAIADLRAYFKDNDLQAKTEYGQALQEAMNKVENRVQELWDKAVAEGIKAEKAESNKDIWYSDRTSFAEQVDEAQTNSWNNRNALFVSDTPEILLDLGLEQLPVLYTKAHLMEALKPKSNNNPHLHGLTPEQVKLMPEILKSPAIIMDSLSTSDDIVVISNYLDNDGAPIIAVIHPNGQGTYELQTQPSNFIKSYYGKDKGFENYIKRALINDKILYISKEKSQSLYRQIGLRLPNGFNKLGFNKIIRQSNSVVNTINQQNSDRFNDTDYLSAVERGDMETAQKMVDEAAKKAGYTVKSFHGTLDKSFTEFKKELIGTRFSYDEKGFFFIDSKSIAEDYATSEFNADKKGRVISVCLKSDNPLIVDKSFTIKEGLGNLYRDYDVIDVWDTYSGFLLEEAEKKNADSIILSDGKTNMQVVFDPEQIKSADPVTYDDDGNVIPLSERFNEDNKDIRYSDRNSYDNALDRSEWRTFYKTLSGDNSSASNIIGQTGVYLPGSNKLIVYSGEKKNPFVKAVYNLGDYYYNIHDGIDNAVERFIDDLEEYNDEERAEAILQKYSYIYGTIFRKYEPQSNRYVRISRESIANRKTDRQEASGERLFDRTGETGEVKNQDRYNKPDLDEEEQALWNGFELDEDESFFDLFEDEEAERLIDVDNDKAIDIMRFSMENTISKAVKGYKQYVLVSMINK